MFRHTNTIPCPTCSGAQVKRRLGGMTENCKECGGSGRKTKPKAEARGAFAKKIEQVPLKHDVILKTGEEILITMDGANEHEVKTKVQSNGKTKTWNRKKKSA